MRKGFERQMHRGYGLYHKTGSSEGGKQACRAQKKKFKRVIDKLVEKDYNDKAIPGESSG